MKQFFKFMFASMLGVLLFIVFLFVFVLGMIGVAIRSAADDKVEIKENSLLRISLNYGIAERTEKNPIRNLNFSSFENRKTIGLDEILHRINAAKDDDRIKGIYLDMSSVGANHATLQEIRDALVDFRTSGKNITSYAEYYSQGAYYLSSAADSVFVNPEGVIDFRGFSSVTPFFKGTLEKLGIEMQVIRVGTYKSAIEPFVQDKMSEANREQVTSYLGSLYQTYLSNISESRTMQVDSLRNIADKYLVRSAEDAVRYGLADAQLYKDELLNRFRDYLGLDSKDDINSISIEDYQPEASDRGSMNKRVAVVYAVGEIMSGEGSDTEIGSERISRAIRKVREDDKVKAVVLRVNSPGGSALASDVIWREVQLTKAVKPIIVSMGDVAASGGYYIACAADSIFAEPNTITGSIGVFGLLPNMQNLLNNKLGITFDEVKTGEYANLASVDRPLTANERSIIQQEVNKVYHTFTSKVAEGRKKDRQYIDSIGQGRVWSGEQAVEIGLVDKLGSLNEAIKAAAEKAGIADDYRLVRYPTLKDPFEALFGNTKDEISAWYTRTQLGEFYPYFKQMKEVTSRSGILARMPYSIEFQ